MQSIQIATEFDDSPVSATMSGNHLEIHELGGGRWIIDRQLLRYMELPPDRDVDITTCGLHWTSFLDIHADDATGDLVIHVTPTRIVRLSH